MQTVRPAERLPQEVGHRVGLGRRQRSAAVVRNRQSRGGSEGRGDKAPMTGTAKANLPLSVTIAVSHPSGLALTMGSMAPATDRAAA
jgi:hypothetical protein